MRKKQYQKYNTKKFIRGRRRKKQASQYLKMTT